MKAWNSWGLIFATISLTVQATSDTLPLGRKTPTPKEGSIIAPKTPGPIEARGLGKENPVAVEDPSEPEAKPYVASIETYGSPRINSVILKETLGKELDVWLSKGLAGAPDALELETKLADKVKKKFGFSTAEWSIIQYFEPGDLALHLTLDVVEPNEVATRMPFLPEPTGTFEDPGNLIKKWQEYEELALGLVESGELQPEEDSCVAYHCPFGHKHAKLKPYEKIFVDGVKQHASRLLEIQAKDKVAASRASATYLLAYFKEGKRVVSAMVERIKDPDAVVRNNALRVLGDIAEFHPEFVIPVKPVLEAFQFPRVSDRSKAIYVAYLLALNSQQVREQILKASVPTLIQIMESTQPDHREIAHNILRKISGKEYPATDALAWTNWYGRLPKERNISKK